MAIPASLFSRPPVDPTTPVRDPRPAAADPARPQEPPARNGQRAAPARGHEMLDLLVSTFGTISDYRPGCS